MKKLKIPVILFLFVIILPLIYIVRSVYNYDIVVTHLLYIPVILIAFLWQYRVIYAIIIIGLALIVTDKNTGNDISIVHDLVRLSLLLFTGIFVAAMKIYIIRLSSYKKYRDILFAVREPMAIVNRTFTVVINNRAFTEMFGIDREENIMSLFGDIMQDEGLGAALSVCFEGSESFSQGQIMTSAGKSKLFEIKCYPLNDDGGKDHAIINFRDITEESETTLQQKRILDRQNLAIDILELLNRKDPGPGVIHEILKLVSENTGIGAIGFKNESDGQYNLYSSAGITVLTSYLRSDCSESGSCDTGHFCIRSLNPGQVLRDAGSGPQPADIFWTNNLDEYGKTSRRKICRCMIAEGLKSCAIIPVLSGSDITGYFILLDRRNNFFNDELLEFYQGIVQSISIALDRVNYERNLKQIINEKELLIREVHHRVKNNMQVITSIISLQASKQTDESVKTILNECQNRVRTMALVHEKLYSSSNYTSINFASYLNTLVPLLMNSYGIKNDQVAVKITADNIQLDINTAIPFAQLVNEIISNVFKHAFPGGMTGSVNIELTRNPQTRVNTLSIRDTGTGLREGVFFPGGGNLGFQLIEALVRQVRGQVRIVNSGGLEISVDF